MVEIIVALVVSIIGKVVCNEYSGNVGFLDSISVCLNYVIIALAVAFAVVLFIKIFKALKG